MQITPVLLRGGALDGTIHRASTSYETWGLTRIPESEPPLWELHVVSAECTHHGVAIWDYDRTVTECELMADSDGQRFSSRKLPSV